ncbi:hypothetical protein B0H11DRAFT_2134190, partial [Mycena galericulata]
AAMYPGPTGMLASLSVLLLLASSAAAQATSLPQCAQGCAQQAATVAGCSLSNTPCLCATSFASSVLQCSGSVSCTPTERIEVSNILVTMCAAGVWLQLLLCPGVQLSILWSPPSSSTTVTVPGTSSSAAPSASPSSGGAGGYSAGSRTAGLAGAAVGLGMWLF